MLTFYGAGKKAAHAAKTVKHGVSKWSLCVSIDGMTHHSVQLEWSAV